MRALLAAVATLEDLVKVGRDSQMALNALEEVAFELGKMDAGEGRRFIEALEHVASAEPDRATWIQDVPSALGLDRI
ncbi:hypothetical protein ACN6K9_002925 [Streptomyces sp. SAS_267]|uniref:hypothetical protein n=1 Tax=Streptomyces sp. SAS_267 TaxID=3412750 RepID=UPI00403C2188